MADLRSWVVDLRTSATDLRSGTQVVLPWPADLRSWVATLRQCLADMCPTAAHRRSTAAHRRSRAAHQRSTAAHQRSMAATCPLHPTRVDLQGDQLAEAGVAMPVAELGYTSLHLHVFVHANSLLRTILHLLYVFVHANSLVSTIPFISCRCYPSFRRTPIGVSGHQTLSSGFVRSIAA